MHGRPSLSDCFRTLACSGLSAAIAHSSRVAASGEEVSDSIAVRTFVHGEE